jgi:hypothetical protein
MAMRRIWATLGLDDLSVAEWKRLLAHVAKHRFVGIEPLIAGPYELPVAAIRELLHESALVLTGLRTGAIAAVHGVALGHADPSVRSEAVARLNEVIRYGAQFGQPQSRPRLLVGLLQGPVPARACVSVPMKRGAMTWRSTWNRSIATNWVTTTGCRRSSR